MSVTARQDAAASLRRSAREGAQYADDERADSPEVASHLDQVSVLLRMAAAWIETSPDIDAFEAPLKAVVGRRAVADDDMIARLAEESRWSWDAAWSWLEHAGYDMSAASPRDQS